MAIALSLLGLTVAPAASAGFPPTPDPSPDCEWEAAERQLGYTAEYLDHGDEDEYASDTTYNLGWRYVACELFPI